MLLTNSQPIHFCSHCSYTTPRKYNLQRHIALVHGDFAQNVSSPAQNVSSPTQNVSPSAQNVSFSAQNVSSSAQNVSSNLSQKSDHICSMCNKQFTRHYSLMRHVSACKGTPHSLQCEKCHKGFTTRSALSRHRQMCKDEVSACRALSTTSEGNMNQSGNTSIVNSNSHNVTNNNISQTNIDTFNNNVNNNITTNILKFPEDGKEFDFFIDKISKGVMKTIANSYKPAIGFNKFVGKVLEDPKNRIVKKTNPNVCHSMIHTDDGWELAHDDDVYPLLTFHMTTAALAKCEDVKDLKNLYNQLDEFRTFVEDVNQSYDDPDKHTIIQRIKLIVINLTRKWLSEEKQDT